MSLLGPLLDIGSNVLNYGMQVEQRNYQRNLQQQVFAREDNAVQRRVHDLEAAGLSPVLAAGSAAQAGPVVSTVTPQLPNDLMSSTIALQQQRERQVDMNNKYKQNWMMDLQQSLLRTQITKEMLNNDILGAESEALKKGIKMREAAGMMPDVKSGGAVDLINNSQMIQQWLNTVGEQGPGGPNASVTYGLLYKLLGAFGGIK